MGGRFLWTSSSAEARSAECRGYMHAEGAEEGGTAGEGPAHAVFMGPRDKSEDDVFAAGSGA